MQLACELAIALWLIFPAAGVDARLQDPPSSANSAEQTPAPPAVPAEQAPAEATPASGGKAAASVAKRRTNAGSVSTGPASGPTKRPKHSPPAPAPDGTPQRVVVREGGAREPAAQIVPGMAPAEATRQRQNAEQWLASADGQLKQLAGRTLDAAQQETVAQIHNYMQGARSALQDGDVRRANTLAEKAHLLAEDLLKH
ncbi:MAG: hypothetical protein ACLPVW_00555 [Terriglobales bacterium]